MQEQFAHINYHDFCTSKILSIFLENPEIFSHCGWRKSDSVMLIFVYKSGEDDSYDKMVPYRRGDG